VEPIRECYAWRMSTLDFFFDIGSPYSYLASTQLSGLAARTGAQVRYLPITLGGVRKQLGTQMPSVSQLQYMSQDIDRWAKKYSVPMGIPPVFPASTIKALRTVVAAELDLGSGARAAEALFAAYWAKLEDISNDQVISAALGAAGFEGEKLLARSADADVKEQLHRNTSLALDRGVFGVPTMFVGERSFWGNDRLQFVEAALLEARANRGHAHQG
jgi:2-hydroxychromene-2-carboxylate isomerase